MFATFYAWLLLGERLTVLQFLGGALILAGIAFVRSEKTDAPLEALLTGPVPTVAGPAPANSFEAPGSAPRTSIGN